MPGDLNKDGRLDENDLTSFLNYTGLRKGDGTLITIKFRAKKGGKFNLKPQDGMIVDKYMNVVKF